MLKAVGGILVILSTTAMGIRKASDLKQQYAQLLYVQRLMYMLQSEMRYARDSLGEIFLHIGSQSEEPYGTWFQEMNHRIEKRNGETLEELWADSVWQNLWECGLREEDIQRLAELGGQLGAVDMEMQMKALELFQMQVTAALNTMREELKVRMRLRYCLGITSGMLIAILLL